MCVYVVIPVMLILAKAGNHRVVVKNPYRKNLILIARLSGYDNHCGFGCGCGCGFGFL